MIRLSAQFVVPGDAAAPLCLLSKPLSLWGGYDVTSGRVIDVTHPQRGLQLAGRILAMTEARGSSSSSSILVEAARSGTAPAAIILSRLDPILVIGSLVAKDLYGAVIPIVLVGGDAWSALATGTYASLSVGDSELLIENGR